MKKLLLVLTLVLVLIVSCGKKGRKQNERLESGSDGNPMRNTRVFERRFG